MTINDAATFAVTSAAASAQDQEHLMRWCTVHLVYCEKWLSRHRLMEHSIPPLAAARQAFTDHDRLGTALRADHAEFVGRRRDFAATEPVDDPELADLTGRLAADLHLYRSSLLKGDVDAVRVVPADNLVTPLYLVDTSELFYPRWLLSAEPPRRLNSRSDLFPLSRDTSLSWIFFQAPVLAREGKVLNVSERLDIIELVSTMRECGPLGGDGTWWCSSTRNVADGSCGRCSRFSVSW